MTELHDVAMFCIFYSGIVMYALWLTLARHPVRVENRRREIPRKKVG